MKPSTYKELLNKNSYFRDGFLLKNINQKVLNEVWKNPEIISDFNRSFYLFEAIIKNKDIKKLKELYSNNDYSPIHFEEGMINSHYDVKVYQQSLALAVEFNDLELIKKVIKSVRFLMWRKIGEVTVNGFIDGSNGVSSNYPEIKKIIPQLKKTRKIYDQLATAGLSHLLNEHEILMFDLHSYIGRNFYCHDYHHGHLVDYTNFYQFVTGKIDSSQLVLIGNRTTTFDKAARDEVNNRYKDDIIGFKQALEKKDAEKILHHFSNLTKFISPADRLHWVSTPHTYFSALMLIHADKFNGNFYKNYKKYIESDEWYDRLHERIIEVDNVNAFAAIKIPEKNFSYAKIAVIFKSHKILNFLKDKLSTEEKRELIQLSKNLKKKSIIN